MVKSRLKNLRTTREVSQKEFARAMKVSQQTVASWETGRTEPSNTALKAIADYFNVSTDYLLGRETPSPPPSKTHADLLGMFDGLNEEGQNALMLMLSSLKMSHAKKEQKKSVVVQQNSGETNFLVTGGKNNYGIVTS